MPRGGKRSGAGRKLDGNAPKRRITITLPDELIHWIDERSKNRSDFIEKLLRRERDGDSMDANR